MADVMTEYLCPVAKPTSCYWKKIWKGLNVMRQNWQFCDVILTSSDNRHFMAHRAMLVASSITFMNYFSSVDIKNRIDSDSKPNLYFPEVPSDVLQVVLDFIYGITPTSPLELLKLCAGSKYFGIDEAYDYSMKYFSSNKYFLKDNDPKNPSLSSINIQAPVEDQLKDLAMAINAPAIDVSQVPAVLPDCASPPKNPFHLQQRVVSQDFTDSGSSDGRVSGMAELSLTDLALGNECPHLKKLVDGASSNELSFDMDLSERLDLKEEEGLNEMDNITTSKNNVVVTELSNYLDRETSASVAQQKQKCSVLNLNGLTRLEALSDPSHGGLIANEEVGNNLFALPLESPITNNLDENIIDDVCTNDPTNSSYSDILSEDLMNHSNIRGDAAETSFDSFTDESEPYSHMLFEGIGATSGDLQNVYRHSTCDLPICLTDQTKSCNARQDLETIEMNSNGGGKMLKFMCSDCGEAFGTSYKLQTHQLKQHNKGKLFSCRHCPFKSPRKKDLQAHCLSQHGEKPPGVKIYTCSSCQYKCIDKNRFEEHEAIHQGILKFSCPLCNKAYTTRRGMKTHLKYHNESRPFKCTLCPSDFKVKSKLTDHMKLIHLQKGVKPYKCGYCNHFTALRGNCNQHIKKNHPGQPVVVIDTMSSSRKQVKNYDYANLQGSDIDEFHEICSTQFIKKTLE